MAPVFTVPALPTTIAGFRPALRSSAIARFSRSTRIAEPVVGRDLPQLLPADAEQVDGLVDAVVDLVRHVDDEGGVPAKPSSRTPGAFARRAVARAVKFAIEPPEVRMPSAVAGRPRISASQATTRRSTWIDAWSPPQQLLFIAEAR